MTNPDLDKQIIKILLTDFYNKDWIEAGEATVNKLTKLIAEREQAARIDELERLYPNGDDFDYINLYIQERLKSLKEDS